MKNRILQGDASKVLRTLLARSVDCVITSPPYFALRDYGVKGQAGLEKTPEAYVKNMVRIFRHVRRVLKDDGTLWLNMGDTYANKSAPGGSSPMKRDRRKLSRLPKVGVPKGLKAKDLIGIPWRLALALQADGWYLRQDIIWHKPNPMPESVTDRCTKSHEYVFLLSKSSQYFYDQKAIREPLSEASLLRLNQPNLENQRGSDRVPGKENGRMKAVAKGWHNHKNDMARGNRIEVKDNHPDGANKRTVWTVPTMPFKEAHFATFPEKLVEPMILAGCPQDGVVLDPFMGAGTTAVVAFKNKRHYIGIELSRRYIRIANRRLAGLTIPML